MTKRAMSAFLAALMLLLTLTGCSTNELGYLNLSKEIGSMTQYEFTNNTELEISGDVAGEDYNISLEVKGVANIENLNSMYMNMDFVLNVNDMGNELPINVVIWNNKVYVSKNAILEAVKVQEEYEGVTENPKVIDALYSVELKDMDYIMVADLSEYYEGVEYNANYKDLYDSAMNYMTSAFKGFDTKLVTKINNGYEIKLTPESTFDFLGRLITYTSNNKDLVYDETIEYVKNIFDNMSMQSSEGMTEAEKEKAIEELEASRQDFYDFIDEAAMLVESEEMKEYEDMFERSSYQQKIYKNGSSYVQDIQGDLVFEDVMMGSLKSTSKISPVDVEIKGISGKDITAEDLMDLYEKTENKINPVNKMELKWYSDFNSAEVGRYRLDGKEDWGYQDYALIEERVYLPLRYIGESFGEEVSWDNEAKKAYVVRGSEKIDMTGVLIDNKTMVKVRDFEKLGYKISYIQEDGLSTATIIR